MLQFINYGLQFYYGTFHPFSLGWFWRTNDLYIWKWSSFDWSEFCSLHLYSNRFPWKISELFSFDIKKLGTYVRNNFTSVCAILQSEFFKGAMKIRNWKKWFLWISIMGCECWWKANLDRSNCTFFDNNGTICEQFTFIKSICEFVLVFIVVDIYGVV